MTKEYEGSMGPLEGYRVWELGDSPAVGFAGRLLLQLGAGVELLEGPEGSALRSLPPFVDDAQRESALFAYLGAGKSSRPIPDAGRLATLADISILLHDRRELPAGWDEAIDAASLPASGRVVVACTPYGQSGPRSEWEGSELTLFQSGGEGFLIPSGLSYEEFPDRPPTGAGRYLGSYQAGTSVALAAVAGLRSSRQAGRTERVDVSMQDAQLSLNNLTMSRFQDGSLERRANRAFSYGGVLRCADGYVELLPIEQHHWDGVREMLGDPEWARDPGLADTVERGRRGAEINVHLRSWAGERAIEDVVRLATEHGVPCGPYQSPAELPDDVQFRARGFFATGDGTEGASAFPGAAWQLARGAPPRHQPAPAPPPASSDGSAS